ncbi:MAG: hypothetical protein J5844_02990 [Clostridia bacterium]|nr:hypothetical protein [Clostridia bacterium]
MKKIAFLVLAALLISMMLVFTVSAEGTPVPEVKVKDKLGVLVAFFNFDNEDPLTPTYAAYGVKIADGLTDEIIADASEDERYPSNVLDFEKLPGVHDQLEGFDSPFAIVKDPDSDLPEWPVGKQTIKLKVLSRSDRNASSSRTYYDGDTSLAYSPAGPIPAQANSGANANRDEWREYSRSTGTGVSAAWNFYHYNDNTGVTDSYVHELIDDIEIWVYPDQGFILKPTADSDDRTMIVCADETYTFPTVASIDPSSAFVNWTDGTDIYAEGESVNTADLYGKSFYATEQSAEEAAPEEDEEDGAEEGAEEKTEETAEAAAAEAAEAATATSANSPWLWIILAAVVVAVVVIIIVSSKKKN